MGAIAQSKVDSDENSVSFALIKRDEFELVSAIIPHLSSYRDYEDWLDFREGSAFALAMSGVEARLIEIDLAGFLKWCRRTSARPNQQALDAYAEMVGKIGSG
jgi:hypothetical protein